MKSILSNTPRGSIIGKDVFTHHRVRLKDPKHSTYVIGAHGTGKSTLLLNLILADIAANDKGVIVLDPHGDLAKDVLSRCPPEHQKRVIYFAPSEQKERILGLNPFEIHGLAEYDLRSGAVMDVFAHAWYGDYSSAPTMQNTLETLVKTLLTSYTKHRTSFLHMMQLLKIDQNGRYWRKTFTPLTEDNVAVFSKWQDWEDPKRLKSDSESSRNKINHILSNDTLQKIMCQPTSASCFYFEENLSKNGILLVNLELMDDEGQKLLGSLILTQLVVMARLRGEKEGRMPCHIYADEFYKFNPQSFVTIINELRKYGLFCTLAHQNLAQLDWGAQAAASNCGNKIIFRVNPKDAEELADHFIHDTGYPFPLYGLSNLPQFQALVRYKKKTIQPQRWIETLRERAQPNPEIVAVIRQRSETYGRTRTEIDHYIHAILETNDRQKQKQQQQHQQPQWDESLLREPAKTQKT